MDDKKTRQVSSSSLHQVNRPLFDSKEFEELYQRKKLKSENVLKATAHYCGKYYKPSLRCMEAYWLDRFPFVKWLMNYNIKENILPDVVSGITIGIVHIPQGLAYGLLASLPAVNGLYVSFFSVIMYVFLGTSNHLSMGTFAITSLMTSSTLAKFEGKLYPPLNRMPSLSASMDFGNETTAFGSSTIATSTISSNNYLSNDPVEAKVMISMSLTFFAGIFHLIFALLHVGCVTKYLSEVIVAGFTTGAAVHIVTSQIASLLGFSTANVTIPFKLVGAYIEIFKNITKINWSTVIVSVVSIFILAIVRELINERYKAKMPMPVPIELIVVIFGTLFSYLFNFNGKWNIRIVGAVPKGIPPPKLPAFSLFSELLGDAISIAIVSFIINISMAKLFAKKYKYEISPNQELIAYGFGNILSSFFSGFPACVALSRCAILESTGAKTQLYSFIASILVLVVCLVIGPLFRTLPNACLASIIVVALKNMLLQILQLKPIYKRSKLEAVAWLVTFLGVVVFDVDIGLYIGIGVSLLLVIIKTQRPRAAVLGNIPNTEIYESVEVFELASEFDDIKIIRYEESLYYANVDNFKYQVIKLSGINPEEVNLKIKRQEKLAKAVLEKHKKRKNASMDNPAFDGENQISSAVNEVNVRRSILSDLPLKHIIIDCSPFNFIDSMGANAILQIYDTFNQLEIKVHLTNCKPVVMKMFKKLGFDKKKDFPGIYPTTHDIVYKLVTEDPQLNEKYKKRPYQHTNAISPVDSQLDIEMLEFYAF